MAKKRKYQKRKKDESLDVKVIGIIIASVLLAILIYANSGSLGAKLSDFLGGMMGWIKYILPIGTFAIAIKIACNDREEEYITHKMMQYVILLICISVVMSIYQISHGKLEISGDLSQILKKAYSLGTSNIGGGAIGTLAAVPLVRLLGNMGAVAVSVGAAVMLFTFVFGLDISSFISSKVEKWLERHENRKVEKEARKQERYEEIEARRLEIMEQRKQARRQMAEANINNQHASQNIEQIKINLNGRAVDDVEENSGIFGLLKGKQKKKQADTKHSITEMANSIENDKVNLPNKGQDKYTQSNVKNNTVFILDVG